MKDNENLETWDGELYLEMHQKTFTTKSDLKRANRRLENKFRLAEMLTVLRGENRTPEITALYKKLLINQFHDILPGSHIHPVFQDAMADYREIETALDAIIGTGNRYFNPLNFTYDALTFVENKRAYRHPYGQARQLAVTQFGTPGQRHACARPPIAAIGCKWTAIGWRRLSIPFV